MLPAGDYGRIRDLLAGIGFDLNAKGVDPARVWDAMKRDKKFIHARNRFVLLERIGRATVAEGVEAGVLERALSRHL
jgi:3-dehydroquinate synthetase